MQPNQPFIALASLGGVFFVARIGLIIVKRFPKLVASLPVVICQLTLGVMWCRYLGLFAPDVPVWLSYPVEITIFLAGLNNLLSADNVAKTYKQ